MDDVSPVSRLKRDRGSRMRPRTVHSPPPVSGEGPFFTGMVDIDTGISGLARQGSYLGSQHSSSSVYLPCECETRDEDASVSGRSRPLWEGGLLGPEGGVERSQESSRGKSHSGRDWWDKF